MTIVASFAPLGQVELIRHSFSYKIQMSTTIHYETAAVKSTVAILKDGRAMEVRRGETTDFSAPGPGSARIYWPSMDAWASQLGPWHSVETWRSTAPALPLAAHPAGKPVEIRPYLAYFLGKADGVSREDIRDALNSYIAAKWGLKVHRTARDVKPAVKDYQLDDFLVTLSGLHPGGLYTARQILNAVLARQIIRKPLDQDASALLQKENARLKAEIATLQGKVESLKACLRVIKATCGSV